jgi:hypothetical protein
MKKKMNNKKFFKKKIEKLLLKKNLYIYIYNKISLKNIFFNKRINFL